MAELDPRETERRLVRLEQQMEQVLAAVRQREEDFGAVRSNAAKVPNLLEDLRGLRQMVGRGGGGQAAAVAPTSAPVVVSPSNAPIDTKQVIRSVAEQLLAKGSLPTLDDLKRIVREEIGTQLRALVNVDQLVERMWKEITATGVEERLAKLLLDRVGREVDTKVVIRQLVDEILARIDVPSLTAPVTTGVVEKLAANYQLAKKSGY